MYIEPNTKIRLIKNCPLDKSQENTIYFTSLAAQTTYFTSTLSGFLFDKNTYQRVHKGVLRVAMNAEALYNCNYLAFQNYSFGEKWFYAFIDKIEYINNVTSEVSYTLDVMQTWHFNYELEQCFVEREHSVTDEIGDNLVEEKLDTGDYICSNYTEPTDLANNDIVLFCTVDENYDDINGYWNANTGMISGLYPVRFPNTLAGANDMIDWIADLPILKTNAIVSACIMPHKLISIASGQTFGHTVQRVTTLMRSDGTAVKNNKCLTYPYNFLYITNYQGKASAYRYEFFNYSSEAGHTNDIVFEFTGGVCPNPAVFAYPSSYKNLSGNYDEGIQLAGYPQVPWNIDAFKAWLAQSASSVAINGMAAGMYFEDYMQASIAAKSASSALVPIGMAGAGGSYLPTPSLSAGASIPMIALAGLAVSGSMHMFMPPQSKGNMSGAAQFSAGLMTLGFMNKHITPEFATIIDDYFTMFGYATNKVKVPNRNVRPEWNYIKTIGCKIQGINSGSGGLPADDADEIEGIYNRGVRFWTNPAHIGDYSYSNAPTIQGGE